MKKIPHLEEPLNSMERFMAHISYRLDIIIEQNNSIIEHLASKDGVTTVNNKLEIETPKPTKKAVEKKKTTKKV